MNKTYVATLVLTVAGPAFASTPNLQGLPAGPLGQAIQRGHDMIMNTTTNPEVKAYVGNLLTCNSCHTDGGDNDHPGNFLSTATKFPAYSPREAAVITLEDRLANCFMRSMNVCACSLRRNWNRERRSPRHASRLRRARSGPHAARRGDDRRYRIVRKPRARMEWTA